MNPDPTFSIIIPTRNGERYIAQTISSVLAQTFPDFQLIILESGSDDRTCEIVRAFSDSRVELHTTDDVLGIEDNWARVLTLDLHPYFTILGHDDILYPGFLAEIVRLIHDEPDASLYTTHFDLVDSAGKMIRSCYPVPYKENADDFLFNLHNWRRDSFGTGYVMRSHDYLTLGGFPSYPDLMYADHMTTYWLANISYKICASKSSFAFRQHNLSTSYVVNLQRIFSASKCYISDLQRTDYWIEPEHQASAKRYIEFMFRSHKHRIMSEVLARNEDERINEFKRVNTHLLQEYPGDPLLSSHDPVSRIYELVMNIPIPSVRRVLYGPIAILRKIRKWQFQKFLNARNR